VKETTLQTPRSVKQEEEEVLQAPEQRFSPVMKTMVSQVAPLQPMEVHCGADVHSQPGKDPMPEQVDAQRRL